MATYIIKWLVSSWYDLLKLLLNKVLYFTICWFNFFRKHFIYYSIIGKYLNLIIIYKFILYHIIILLLLTFKSIPHLTVKQWKYINGINYSIY
jgi:hypothetical protein